jgi:hypothetical protein
VRARVNIRSFQAVKLNVLEPTLPDDIDLQRAKRNLLEIGIS